MTAADIDRTLATSELMTRRIRTELARAIRRASDWQTATNEGGRSSKNSISDPTAAAVLAVIDRHPDKMSTLKARTLRAQRQLDQAFNDLAGVLDEAITMDAAIRAHTSAEQESVDDINRRDGYCQNCGSIRYHHGTKGDALRLLRGTLKTCDACRIRWERTEPQNDETWAKFVAEGKSRKVRVP